MIYLRPNFKLIKEDISTQARAGVLYLPQGEVETPIFMPVGTLGTVRGIPMEFLQQIGYQLILSNTYHLTLSPGIEILKNVGGIKKLTQWKGSLLTDSGGFQIFSLPNSRTITKNHCVFKDHKTGNTYTFTPENVIDIQRIIGSDIMMVLDICSPSNLAYNAIEKATEQTYEWAKRAIHYHQSLNDNPFLFGIIQGGVYETLRKLSAQQITSLQFDGYALGGLSVGESREELYHIVEYTTPFLPKNQVRYLMGVGTPIDLIENVYRGIDIFDCVLPTRNARHGHVFSNYGKVNLNNAKHKMNHLPIDPSCSCFVCQKYPASYLHHLLKTKEIVGYSFMSYHNLHYLYHLMKTIRYHIQQNSFLEFYHSFKAKYLQG